MADNKDDKRMELTEHLQELRARIMRSLIYLVLGAILAFIYFRPIYDFLKRPLDSTITKYNNSKFIQQTKHPINGERALVLPTPVEPGKPVTAEKFNELLHAVEWIRMHPMSTPILGDVFHGFHEMFLVQLQVSILIGFIMTIPLIIWELAQFVTPALTEEERRPLKVLIPISVALMLFGVTVAYLTLYFAMAWFVSFLDAFSSSAALMQSPNDYVMFFIKMMAAFAIAFQLPVVLMGGAYIGVVTSSGLAKNWRWGIVLAALGGLLTPSNDLPSMALMAIPLLLLYFGSIILVKMVEGWKAKEKAKGH